MHRKSVRRAPPLAVRLSCLISGVFLCSVVPVTQGAETNGQGIAKYGEVDIARLRQADRNPEQWGAMGRTLNGTYYSPLSQINASNVDRLGFVWQFKTGTYRGMDATPLFVDGILYFPGIWGSVYALDAATGKEIWRFTPKNDGEFAKWAASDVVTRGIAVLNRRVYTVSTDCHLFSLNAANGQIVWQTDTLAEQAPGYVCQGAPTVTDRYVIVGNAGGDNLAGGVRGYISAFDLKSGHLVWRFFTVPKIGERNPSQALVAAARTWDPTRDLKFGGGGTVWGQMVYDPELDLVYFGTGNAAPYNAPRDWAGGRASDRLYAASIVAVHARTGEMAWYYQTTPGDVWDFDAAANLVLASLRISGVERQVLMQANKNGFFYLIDRRTGRPLSAAPFAYINWASGIDAGFRPIVNQGAADYNATPKIVFPSVLGAHSWPPMSYNPQTGLVYIPSLETGAILADVTKNPGARIHWLDQQMGVTEIVPDKTLSYDYWESLVGKLPHFKAPFSKRSLLRGILRAWDPLTRQVVWEQETSEGYAVLDGGTMTTAGGLVIAGREDGALEAYDAKTGSILKTIQTGSAIMAAPMTFEVGGKQYISVLCGHGGMFLNFLGTAAWDYINEDRILTFAIDGMPETPTPPRKTPPTARVEPPLARNASSELVEAGRDLFITHCARCHTLDTPAISSDLTRSAAIYSIETLDAILLRGALSSAGMGKFDDVLTERDLYSLQAYLVNETWDAYQDERAKSTTTPEN
jgi:quinohemoprotein ethanol dehydrogenase